MHEILKCLNIFMRKKSFHLSIYMPSCLLHPCLARQIQDQGRYNHNSYKRSAVDQYTYEIYSVPIRLSISLNSIFYTFIVKGYIEAD